MVSIKNVLFYSLIGWASIVSSCKSDKQEIISKVETDTTMVVRPSGMVLNEAPATNTNPKRAVAKSSDHIPGTAPAEDQDANPLKAEDMNTMSQQDMEYNEFPAKPATYPGGAAALNQYLAAHIKYPAQARENKIEGTVYANILVDESGALGDVTFLKPLGYGLEEEVLKAIKGMPKLIPAEDQGKPVKTKFILPVKFYMK